MIDNIVTSLDFNPVLPSPEKEATGSVYTPELTPIHNIGNISDLFKDSGGGWFADKPQYLQNERLTRNYFATPSESSRYFQDSWHKKDPIFKDPKYYDNEDLNAQRQGWYSKMLNGFGKIIPSFLSSFGSSWTLPGFYDNAVSRGTDDMIKKWEDLFPNYYSAEERNSKNPLKGFLPFTSGFGNFWGDKFVKNLGFMGGAIAAAAIQDAIITSTTFGSGTVPVVGLQLGKAANWLEKAFFNVGKAARLTESGIMAERTMGIGRTALAEWQAASTYKKGLTLLKAGIIDLQTSHGESSVEGISGAITINENLISEFVRKNYRTPTVEEYAEIKKTADAAANVRYGLNLITLAITNAVQFGSVFSPFKSSITGMFARDIEGWGAREFIDNTGNIVSRAGKDIGWGEKAFMAAKSEASKNFFSEATQEGLQYSYEKAAEDYASKKYNKEIRGGLGDYVDSQLYGIKKMFTEKEGLESMIIGGLTGGLVHIGMQARRRYTGEDKASQKYRDELISKYNSIKATDIISTEKFQETLREVAERDGIAFDSAVTTHVLALQMANAVKKGDVTAYKALQHDQLFNMIETAVKLNKFEAVEQKLKGFKDLEPTEFLKLINISTEGLSEDEKRDLITNTDTYIDNLIEKADHIKNVVELVNQSMVTDINPAKQPLEWTAFQDLKTTLAHGLSFIEDLNSRIPEEVQKIIEKNPFLQDFVGDIINIKKVQDYLDTSNEDLKTLQNRYNILNKSIEQSQKDNNLFNQEILNKQIKERDELKTQISEKREFLNESAEKIKVYNTVEQAEDASHPKPVAAYKALISHILGHEIKIKGYNKPLLKSQVDEIVNGLADLNLMDHSLNLFLDSNKKLQTPEGQRKFLNEYITTYKMHNSAYLKRVRESKYSILKNYKQESIDSLAKQISAIELLISENESDLDTQKVALEELRAINIDTLTPEEKEVHEKEIKELEDKVKETEETIQEHKDNMEELAQTRADLIEDKDKPTEIKVEEPIVVPTEEVKNEEPEIVIVPTEETSEESLEDVDIVGFEEEAKKAEEEITESNAGLATKGTATIFTDTRDTGKALAPAYLRFQRALNFFTKPGGITLQAFMISNDLEFVLMVPDERFFEEGNPDNPKDPGNQLFPKSAFNNDPQMRGQVIVAVKKGTKEPIKLFWNGVNYEVNDKGEFFAHTVRDPESRTNLKNNPDLVIPVEISAITNGKFKFYIKTKLAPVDVNSIFKADNTLSDFIEFEVPGYGAQIQPVEGGVPIMKGFPYLIVKSNTAFEEGVEAIPYLRIPLLAKNIAETSHLKVITKIFKEFENIINDKSKVNPEDVQKFLESIMYNKSNINMGSNETLSIQMAFTEHGKGKSPFISISRKKDGKEVAFYKIFTTSTSEGWKIKSETGKGKAEELLKGLRTNIAINPVDAIQIGKDGLEYLPLKTRDTYLKWWMENSVPSSKIKLTLPDTKSGDPKVVMSPLSRAIEYKVVKPGALEEIIPEETIEETPEVVRDEVIPEVALDFINDIETLNKPSTEKVYIKNKGRKIIKKDATVGDQQEEIKSKAKELEDIIKCIWK